MMVIGPCPTCDKDHPSTASEKRPNGNTVCGACGSVHPTSKWEVVEPGPPLRYPPEIELETERASER